MIFWWLRTKVLLFMVIITVWVLFNCCHFSLPPPSFAFGLNHNSRFKKWHHFCGWCKALRPQLFLQPQTGLMRNAVFTIARPQKQLTYVPIAGLSEMLKSVSLLGGKKITTGSLWGCREKVFHNISVCESLYRLQLLVLCGEASRQHKLHEGRSEESRKLVPREHGRH